MSVLIYLQCRRKYANVWYLQKSLLTRKSKDTHFKLKHLTKYKCSNVACNKQFVTQERLTAHEKVHTKAKSDLHVCKICKKEFLCTKVSLQYMEVHILHKRNLHATLARKHLKVKGVNDCHFKILWCASNYFM